MKTFGKQNENLLKTNGSLWKNCEYWAKANEKLWKTNKNWLKQMKRYEKQRQIIENQLNINEKPIKH